MDMFPLLPTYGDTHGLALMQGIEDAGTLVFTIGDAHAIGGRRGLAPAQVNVLAARLVLAGWLRRIKRGLYATTGKLPGSTAPHDFVVALALAKPSALSHRTALHLHGLVDQVPRAITCTTTAKVVTPSMRGRERGAAVWVIDGLRVQMVTVRTARFFGIEEVWADQRTKVATTDRERTILDLVADPARIGGMGEALAILDAHHQSLDVQKLVSYAVRLDVAAAAKRLGWALESFGVKERVLAPLLAVPVKMIQPIDPRRQRTGPVIARWRVQDNLTAPLKP
jgi:predicted transcriptional regulator of viral defense system